MGIGFRTLTIPHTSIKINGNIKKSIAAYRKWQVPMSLFLSNFLAVKSKGDFLVPAENPWLYFNRGIEGHQVESGMSVDETVFRFASMNLKDELPTDVINAAFYSNKNRNDSDFELGYLLQGFKQIVKPDDNVLIVNPTPSMVYTFEESHCKCKQKVYAVTDDTVAKLYHIQFPNSTFYSFEQLPLVNNIDSLLIVNRDQKISNSGKLLASLDCCNDKSIVLGLIPNAWFDSTNTGAHSTLADNGFSIKQILLLDTNATNSTPRKKMLVVIEKGARSTIHVVRSSFNKSTGVFSILEEDAHINESLYLESDRSIISLWKESQSPKEDVSVPIYNKANEYKFSKEISLFYRIYSGRKNKFAGIAYYNEMKDIEPISWGKKISPDIEKGLRFDTREEVVRSIEKIAFNEKVYPYIRMDIESKLIGKIPLSFKTLWLYCWSLISDSAKYEHEFMCQIFSNATLADIAPQCVSGKEILYALAITLNVDLDSISYKNVDSIYFLLKTACEHKLIPYNPLEPHLSEYSRRASERQQDVRNALVKKHLSVNEEQAVFRGIIGTQAPVRLLSSEKSILLASAIRLFTGISIREVAALKWGDLLPIEGSDGCQLTITKFVDTNGKLMQHAERQNWKRFRIVPVPPILRTLLLARKQYLTHLGIDETYLSDCPIVLGEERLSDMKDFKRIPHCRPSKISKSSNELIKLANIPENTIVLPDEKNDLIDNFNRYHGDIFQTNFHDKATHVAYMTNGEISYILGIDAPDTFSRHYCDYTNDFIQLGIIQKYSRWELPYERMVTKMPISTPSHGVQTGKIHIEAGPYRNGVASVDLIIENNSDSDSEVIVKSIHGLNVNSTTYGGTNG